MGIKDRLLQPNGWFNWSKGSVETPTNEASSLPKKDLVIINKIIGEFKDRSRKLIKTWRDGLQAAENVDDYRWYLIQDLYDDTIDGHEASVRDTRKMATTNHEFYVVDKKTGEKLEEQTNFLDKKWFFDFMEDALDSIFKKYSVFEVTKGFEFPIVELIPRRNTCINNKRVYLEVAGDDFIDYSEEKAVIEVIHKSPFGILNDIMPNLIWKKNALQAWAEFSEKFGMPLISATTSNRQDIARVETMLKKMGEAAQAVLPTGTTVEVHDMANAGNPNAVYEKQAKFHNDEISKRYLGGTMISDNGSSKSQSEVHERTLDDKISVADRRSFRFIVNDQLFPVLQTLGYPFDNTKMAFQFDDTEELELKDHWDIVSDAVDKFDFDEKGIEWISKKFNLPITGLKKQLENNQNGNFKQATSMWAMAVATGVTLPEYEHGHTHKHPIAATLSKSLLDKLNVFDNQIADLLYNNKLDEADLQRVLKGKAIADELRNGLFEGWGDRRLKVDWTTPDHRTLSMMEMNLFKFSHTKCRAEILMLNQLLIDKDKLQIKNFADFKEQASKINKTFNETYLQTEHQFTVATAQNSARYMEFIQEQNDIETWEYQTVGDNQVRPEHEALDGRVFRLDDVEARKVWPPNGYRCRCEALQFVGKPGENLMNGKEAINVIFPDKKSKDLFAVNRADIGQVFITNQMYLNSLDGTNDRLFNKAITEYKYSNFGLEPFSTIRKSVPGLKLDATITADNVKELFKNNAGTKAYNAMGFEDYLNRKLIIKEKAFKQHTSGKYISPEQNRHQLFPHITDVLSKPDEVYLRDVKKGQLRYLKFYKDQTLVVDTTITNDAFEIETWYKKPN